MTLVDPTSHIMTRCAFSPLIYAQWNVFIQKFEKSSKSCLRVISELAQSRFRDFSNSSQSWFRIILRLRFFKEESKKWKCFTVPKKIQTYTYKILTVQLKTIRAIKLPLKTESVTAIAAYVTAGWASCYSWQNTVNQNWWNGLEINKINLCLRDVSELSQDHLRVAWEPSQSLLRVVSESS